MNDGVYDSFLPLNLYEVGYRRWNELAFGWILKKAYKFGEVPVNNDQRENRHRFVRDSFYAFLFGRDLPGRSGNPALKSHDFSAAGICTLRNGEMMATLDYGPGISRGHLDKLSFTLYANNALLVPDYGAPLGGSHIRDWYAGTASHNAVVVDGASQIPSQHFGLGTHSSGTFVQYAEATARDHYPGVLQTRRIALVGGACLICDEMASDREHDYDWIMHCEGTPEVVEPVRPSAFDISKYPQTELEQAFEVAGSCRVDWLCENGTLQFHLWSDLPRVHLALGACPAGTAESRSGVLMCRERASNAHFVTMPLPSCSCSKEVTRQGRVIRVAERDMVHYISFRTLEPDQFDGDFGTDGEIAALRTVNGDIAAIALINGTWIRWMGETVLECPSVVECVEVFFKERSPLIRYCCDTAGTVRLKTSARAMRINGHRTAATTSGGTALLRVTPRMLGADLLNIRS